MKKSIVILVLLLLGMEFLGWQMYKKSQNKTVVENASPQEVSFKTDVAVSKAEDVPAQPTSNLAAFPPSAVEIVNGKPQRTIHMGVRKWQWDGAQLEANYGEKVILILHNADIEHAIVIPELGVKEKISPEGAVVMFDAVKRGTFDFFCDLTGHPEMVGKIKIE